MTVKRLLPKALSSALLLGLLIGGDSYVVRAVEPQSPQDVALTEPATPRAMLDKYCVTCHNARLKTAGLMLDELDVANVGTNTDAWEKVLRRLRSETMPPAKAPRPSKGLYTSLSGWLETSLDEYAAAHPNPGRVAVHRLNRTEYQNVIRDLLALDIDAAAMLPGDDAAFGFDNIADMLKVSPESLDSYLTAANKISRLAVGDSAMGLGSRTYTVSKYLRQNDRADEALPFGSNGGAAINHYFPYDGEYAMKIRVSGQAFAGDGIEVRLDDQLVATLVTKGRGFDAAPEVGAVETRIPAKAGPHIIGVTIKRSRLENETRFPEVFPWGNSAVFPTNIGAVDWLKIDTVEIIGPHNPVGPGDTPSRRRIFVCQPTSATAEDACALNILRTLTRRAYRRPVSDGDVQAFVTVYKTARKKQSFDGSIQVALERLLMDPAFLFRIQRDPADAVPGVPYRLSDVDLASRLSFFLWSSMPDDELLRVAEQGKLKDPKVFEQQVRRLLADPKADSLVTNFATQWLYLRNVKGLVPDTFNFPDWDDDLRAASTRETELFLTSQLRDDRSIMELLTADYTFLNERLAEHYGIPGVYGTRFRRVTYPDGRRAGLLGQASILAVTSQPNRTSPVQRGKWVLENLLGTPPPPPPPNVPDLPANDAKEAPKTIRERMENHRKNPVCSGCHSNMDPLGFALENFDAVGTYRTVADGQPVDNKSAMADGTRVDGPEGLRSLVQSRRSQFTETVTEKVLTYAVGRGVEASDMPAIRKIVRAAEPKNYTWSSLILGVTTSEPFQMSIRRAE